MQRQQLHRGIAAGGADTAGLDVTDGIGLEPDFCADTGECHSCAPQGFYSSGPGSSHAGRLCAAFRNVNIYFLAPIDFGIPQD